MNKKKECLQILTPRRGPVRLGRKPNYGLQEPKVQAPTGASHPSPIGSLMTVMPGIEPKYFRRLDFGSRAQRRSHDRAVQLCCTIARCAARTFGLTLGVRVIGAGRLRADCYAAAQRFAFARASQVNGGLHFARAALEDQEVQA